MSSIKVQTRLSDKHLAIGWDLLKRNDCQPQTMSELMRFIYLAGLSHLYGHPGVDRLQPSQDAIAFIESFRQVSRRPSSQEDILDKIDRMMIQGGRGTSNVFQPSQDSSAMREGVPQIVESLPASLRSKAENLWAWKDSGSGLEGDLDSDNSIQRWLAALLLKHSGKGTIDSLTLDEVLDQDRPKEVSGAY